MHSERDFLMKRVFPELAEWCSLRKLNLIDVDLRWGVTEKDAQDNKRVVEVCLDHINECRPLFLCFLGDRRGWVPAPKDISENTLHKYPLLKNYIGTSSVTELEILHAMIQTLDGVNFDPKTVEKYCMFFHRNSSFIDDVKHYNPEALSIYQGSSDSKANALFISEHDLKSKNWIEYTCRWDNNLYTPEIDTSNSTTRSAISKGRLTDFRVNDIPLEKIIIENLKSTITELYPDNQITDFSEETEQEQQERFIFHNTELYIQQPEALKFLHDYLSSSVKKAAAVISPAGTGKTTLMAYLTKEIIQTNKSIVYRFIGASNSCNSEIELAESLIDEFVARGWLDSSVVPQMGKQKLNKFSELLNQCQSNLPFTIILDGIDQLGVSFDNLYWIPEYLNENIKFIFTYKNDIPINTEKYHVFFNITTFENVETKRRFIIDYLSKYLKDIDESEIDSITAIPGTQNPLFLKILLSELRVFGSFELLKQKICSFWGENPSTAFEQMLIRMEADPVYSELTAKDAVTSIFGLLACSRNGLQLYELASIMVQLFGEKYSILQCLDAVSLYIRQCRAFISKRGIRIDLRYDSFRRAILTRYKTSLIHFHSATSEYFLSVCDPTADETWQGSDRRGFTEYLYHLSNVNQPRLNELLIEYSFIERMLHCSDIKDLTSAYNRLKNTDWCHMALSQSLIMSSDAIRRNVQDLPAQLWGRLCDTKNEQIQTFLTQMCEYVKYPWLKSIGASMPFTDHIVNTISLEGPVFRAEFVTNENIFLIWEMSNYTYACGLYSTTQNNFIYKNQYSSKYRVSSDYIDREVSINIENGNYVYIFFPKGNEYPANLSVYTINIMTGLIESEKNFELMNNPSMVKVSGDGDYTAIACLNESSKRTTESIIEFDLTIYEETNPIIHYQNLQMNSRDRSLVCYNNRFKYSSDSRFAVLPLASNGTVVLFNIRDRTEILVDISDSGEQELRDSVSDHISIRERGAIDIIGDNQYLLVRTNKKYDIVSDFRHQNPWLLMLKYLPEYILSKLQKRTPKSYEKLKKQYRTYLIDIRTGQVISEYNDTFWGDNFSNQNNIFGLYCEADISTAKIQKNKVYFPTASRVPGTVQYLYTHGNYCEILDHNMQSEMIFDKSGIPGRVSTFSSNRKYCIALSGNDVHILLLSELQNVNNTKSSDPPKLDYLVIPKTQRVIPFKHVHKDISRHHSIKFDMENSFDLKDPRNLEQLCNANHLDINAVYRSRSGAHPLFTQRGEISIWTKPNIMVAYGRNATRLRFIIRENNRKRLITMPICTKEEIRNNPITENDIHEDALRMLTVPSEDNLFFRFLSDGDKKEILNNTITKKRIAELLNHMYHNSRFKRLLLHKANILGLGDDAFINKYKNSYNIGLRYFVYRRCLQSVYLLSNSLPSIANGVPFYYDDRHKLCIYGVNPSVIQNTKKPKRKLYYRKWSYLITGSSDSGNIMWESRISNTGNQNLYDCVIENIDSEEELLRLSLPLTDHLLICPSDPSGVYFLENDCCVRIDLDSVKKELICPWNNRPSVFQQRQSYRVEMDIRDDIMAWTYQDRIYLSNRSNTLSINHDLNIMSDAKPILNPTYDGDMYLILTNKQIYHIANYSTTEFDAEGRKE